LYPALSEVVRRDRAELGRKYVEARNAILGAGQFGAIGVIVVSPWFFGFLYDSRYIAAAGYAPPLVLASWFGILHSNASAVLVALGKVHSLAWSHAVKLTVTAAGCVGGSVLWGMSGFIAGIALGAFSGYLSVAISLRRQEVKTLSVDMSYSALVFVVAYGLVILPQHFGLFASKPLLVATGGIFALGGSAMLAYRALKSVLAKGWREAATKD
jgi:O-antigen/teichoic acid export membrane protein